MTAPPHPGRLRAAGLALCSALALLQLLAQAPHAAAAAAKNLGMCRMDIAAGHQFCGLPLELSNFQGQCGAPWVPSPARMVPHCACSRPPAS
jgi:hypothetical protein